MKAEVVKAGMKKSDIERLSGILSRQEFLFSKCTNETRIKIVRMQILIDPIAEQLKKARETADKQFMSERLKKLLSHVQQKKVSPDSGEAEEFQKLFTEYNENMEKAITPLLDERVDVKLDKLSLKQYEGVLDSNATWLNGELPKFLFLNIVDEKLEEKKEETME